MAEGRASAAGRAGASGSLLTEARNVEVTGAARFHRAASVWTAGLDMSLRAMTYGLNSVAKWILEERSEVVAVVVRTKARRSIVFATAG